MVLAEGACVTLVRPSASVDGVFKAGVTDAFKPHMVALTDEVALPTLKKRSLCCLISKRLKVFSGELALN